MTVPDSPSFVNLVEMMGGDLAVVNSARVSYGKSSVELSDRDKGLIYRLMRDQHGTPFEQSSFTFYVKCPIFVAREWFRHRMGCLAGDTEITLSSESGKTVYKRTIQDLYYGRHGIPLEEDERRVKNGLQARDGETQAYATRRRVADPDRRMIPNASGDRFMRVLNEETGRFTIGKMAEVWESGEKELFLVKTVEGHEVRVSAEHPFLTDDGWIKAGDLTGKEMVASSKLVPARARQIPPRLREGIGIWTQMMRDLLIPEAGTFCYRCNGYFEKPDLALDHVVSVSADLSKALDEKNLKPACKDCHRAKTNTEQPSRKGQTVLGVKWVQLDGKPVSDGWEMTYDIEMQGPDHNYMANGLVVHNSFNEISGRYTKMNTEFYVPKTFRVPSEERKQMDYKYENADETTNALARSAVTEATSYLTNVYNYLINPPYQEGEEEPEGGWGLGVAKEHARLILPLNLYTEFRWTVNARSLMNFLALRTHPTAMKEIRLYAMWIEQLFKNEMPVTHAAWIQNEKVAP